MTTQFWDRLLNIIQKDPGQRGLGSDPATNLFNACPDDLRLASLSLAQANSPHLAILTGFFIPTATPPCGETDGPLGALFLARALTPLGIRVSILTDGFAVPALRAGLDTAKLVNAVRLIELPNEPERLVQDTWDESWTHLLALERVGPSHTPRSIEEQSNGKCDVQEFVADVPERDYDRCHTMRGFDVTPFMSSAHLFFERAAREHHPVTIGIGDGGNEIGLGKIPWRVIRKNIPRGDVISCRIATDYLIVCGISNWGAYALAAGVYAAQSTRWTAGLADPETERRLLRTMVNAGPLVDGVLGRPSVSVDGLDFDDYFAVLREAAELMELGAGHDPC